MQMQMHGVPANKYFFYSASKKAMKNKNGK